MKRGHGFIWAKALVILCGVLLFVGCDRRTEASMPERLTEVILETPMSFATRFYPMDGMTCLDITAGENGYLLLAQENDVMQEIALDASFQVLSRQSAAPEAKALLREGKACFTYEGQAETGFSVRQNGEEKFTVQGEPNCQMAAVGQTLYLVTAGQLYVDGQQVSLPENWSATGLLKLKGQMLVALASHEGEVEISFLYPVSPNLREVAAPEEGTSFSGLAGLCSWDDSYGYLLRENQICRTDGEELIVYIDLTQQNLDGAQLLRILPLTGGKLLLLWSDGFTVCTPTLE